MTVIPQKQDELNAHFDEDGRSSVPRHYGRPARTVVAVRNGVGVTERRYGVIVVEGSDRVTFVDNAVSNRVPPADGQGCYALLLDPTGAIRADLYVYTAGERVLVFAPDTVAADIAAEWTEHTFIQDVSVREATDDFGIFGVHGPAATEKVASVLNGTSTPETHLHFARGTIADKGVTVVRTDAPLGEEGYDVICSRSAADRVFDALLNFGLNAAPFGTATWEMLTLEAGTPCFETELAGEIPNVVGIRNALDFEKGCYVGQEVVSRVENRGRPSRRLVGMRLGDVVGPSDEILDETGEPIGTVTRSVDSPTREEPIGFGLVDFAAEPAAVRPEETTSVTATPVDLPFVLGSDRSERVPSYPTAEPHS